MDSTPAQLSTPQSAPEPSARLPAQFWSRAGVRAGLAFGALMGRPIEAAGQRMDPTMSALIRFVRKLPQGGAPASGGGLHGLQAFRKQYEAAPGLTGLHPDPLVPPQPVAGLPGAREYLPLTAPRATMLYFHGGGFIIGSPATHDALCRRLARRAGVRVINAAYPLAPEHPFPAAHDAAAAAWAWVRANRPGPYILAGDSAGANLAAGLGLGDGQGAALTVLLYPVTDMLHQDGLYPSIELFREGYLLTAAGLEECARLLLRPGADRADLRLSPQRADLSRAAPSLVMTAGFDPLRDQGRAWVTALQASGRPAWLLEEEGLVHGFADFAGVVPAARRAVDRLAAAVAERLDEDAAHA
jgi:acetyl esterase